MLKKLSLNHILFFLLIASTTALIAAYISQYVFDYQPCILCLYQRKPFFAIILLAASALLFSKHLKAKKIIFFLCLSLLATNFAIAFYHSGVEQKIFQGLSTCSSESLNDFENIADLEAALANTKAARCDQPSFFFLGLTMAAWNMIFCLALFFIAVKFYQKL